ncbi:hypothetical protein [Mangrovibrevibacter kandeliae]|uniref:hypothetical protein n=1 Tax=Mangrovibrevibacter kandeliae TaxID=2968473 RepID=UPI002117463C|nr:hypothetical protein [Aurantimonas sp. CSK15Z-1]MCQ8783757.1 hypothetical protein [Aurantimonas sp. CSK15Z-1]
MEVGTFKLTLPGPMLKRGFWLYVWHVITEDGREVFYVGRTGDNSSPNASPPYIRMGQHLGALKNQNALRTQLQKRKIDPEKCQEFRLTAHGPIHPEVVKPDDYRHSDAKARSELMEKHIPLRNLVGAMEKRLAQDMAAAGYDVLNNVKWRHDIPDAEWRPVRDAFAADFPKLNELR